jgi:uncharacterized protein involved in response to NO
MAAIDGFLLTAIPNWTRRLPISGYPLALLVGHWLLGRLICLISTLFPFWLTTAADLSLWKRWHRPLCRWCGLSNEG